MILGTNELNMLCEKAKNAAILAGEFIQSQFDEEYMVNRKEGGDSIASQVFTEIDIKAQEIIIDELTKTVEEYNLGLLTEEFTDDGSRFVRDHFWVIDPLDGTLPFTEGKTGYAVSIALVSKQGDPLLGVVYIPDLQENYTAIKGEGLMKNGIAYIRPLSKHERLDVFMDRSFLSDSEYSNIMKALQSVKEESQEVKLHTSYGGVRNALSVLKARHACYFKYPKTVKGCGSIWDYAATRLFFEEANCVVSNANGGRLHLNDPTSTFMNRQGILFCTNAELQNKLVNIGKTLKLISNH